MLYWQKKSNWSRLLTLTLTWASFIPPIRHVWHTKDSRGISSAHLLFNLLCATDHVFIKAYSTAMLWTLSRLEDLPEFDLPYEIAVSALDWINLAQVLGIWVLSNIFFALCLYHTPPTRPHHRLRILLALAIYIFFLLSSLIPLALDLTTDIWCPPNKPHNCEIHDLTVSPVLLIAHMLLLPIITLILPVLGFYKQARRQQHDLTRSSSRAANTLTPERNNLNRLLARPRLLQAAIFAVSAVLWIFRLAPVWKLLRYAPPRDPSEPAPPPPPLSWLRLVLVWWVQLGYVAVDDGVFAVGQGVLGYLGLRQGADEARGYCGGDGDAERRPLLAADEERSSYLSGD
ncbi:hypothetical protein BO82DRAFT_391066 [Aspergillus uvarum CBS 121591]|uniref:Uncharacterized protein n=1 Tax=Aspergillus uvarum CBS 121591 TaxID=1448315 RepID=A0A319CBX2_9EURO|nr:hypothetical protein BO82DRAFT_391066 [Aspergillus uvarum CBS 121591]PYH83085.1 hypothetical protein BO82DRAFT_391066 [Aspergillus uvarum CBS 121591]